MNKNFKKIDPKNLQIFYSAAVDLWIHEGAGIWIKFTGMVYVHSILILTIGLLIADKCNHLVFLNVLSGSGISISVICFLIIERSFMYHHNYMKHAKRLEIMILKVNDVPEVKKIGPVVGPALNGKKAKAKTQEKLPIRIAMRIAMLVLFLIYCFGFILYNL